MKATTIKIDGELLEAIEKAKPQRKSVSTFIREVLREDLDRREMAKAARKYHEFLEQNPDEARWLEAWESSNLLAAVKKRHSR